MFNRPLIAINGKCPPQWLFTWSLMENREPCGEGNYMSNYMVIICFVAISGVPVLVAVRGGK